MALSEVVGGLGDRLPLIAAAILAVAGAVALPPLVAMIKAWATLSKIPMVGKEGGMRERIMDFVERGMQIYGEGYTKFKDDMFRVSSFRPSPVVVLSPRFLQELQKLPDDVLSMQEAVGESMAAKYTMIPTDVPVITHSVKSDLTPSLGRFNPVLAEETSQAIADEIGECGDWTPMLLNPKLLRVIARVSGRIFIGTELARDEEYMDSAVNYTTDVANGARAVFKLMPWERWYKAPRLAEIKRLESRKVQAKRFLEPVCQARLEAQRDPKYVKPDDMLQWMMDRQLSRYGDLNADELAEMQLGISFAAIHTTSLTSLNVINTLAAMPEVIPELRAEIEGVLRDNEGVFTSRALQDMKKLDSFMRETQRMWPLSSTSFVRKTLKPFHLSNGQFIPAGVTIEIPFVGVTRDPDFFEDPDSFDPWRFYKPRAEAAGTGARSAGIASQNQFVNVNPLNLGFGFGRHACPGRFFAANEIKLILAAILQNYDMRLLGTTERYPNVEFAQTSRANTARPLLLRRVRGN